MIFSVLQYGKLKEINIITNWPSEKASPRKTPTKLIAKTFSKDAAATPRVGIPWSTPNPFFCSSSRDGTTTAGETAAIIKLGKETGLSRDWTIKYL